MVRNTRMVNKERSDNIGRVIKNSWCSREKVIKSASRLLHIFVEVYVSDMSFSGYHLSCYNIIPMISSHFTHHGWKINRKGVRRRALVLDGEFVPPNFHSKRDFPSMLLMTIPFVAKLVSCFSWVRCFPCLRNLLLNIGADGRSLDGTISDIVLWMQCSPTGLFVHLHLVMTLTLSLFGFLMGPC